MYYYAQLNSAGVCVAISALHEPVEAENLIPLQDFNQDKLFRQYADGQWSSETYEPEPVITESVTLEDLNEKLLIAMGAIADLYEELVTGGE